MTITESKSIIDFLINSVEFMNKAIKNQDSMLEDESRGSFYAYRKVLMLANFDIHVTYNNDNSIDCIRVVKDMYYKDILFDTSKQCPFPKLPTLYKTL